MTHHAAYLSGQHARLVQQARERLNMEIGCTPFSMFSDTLYADNFIRGWHEMDRKLFYGEPVEGSNDLLQRKLKAWNTTERMTA